MFPQVFEISLDQERPRFIAGQMITGRVVLVLLKEKAVKGIKIRFLGAGFVSWEGGISGLKYGHNVYSESEVYLDTKVNLLCREDGREQLLEPGRYDYPFTIQLPSDIPSSFEGQYGHIRYTLEASIQRSWKDDHIAVVPVEIRGLLDLNGEPQAKEIVKIFKEKHVGLMLCQNGPLSVNFLLSKAGFVTGDIIQFGVEIRNNASVKISAVIVSLRSHVTYKVGSEKKSQADKFIQCVGPSVEMKGYLIWQNHFQIPDLPPNPLIGCSLMDLRYYLEIKLVLERWTDLKICTPVIIGTIPFYVPESTPGRGNSVKFPDVSVPPQSARNQSNSNHVQPLSIPESHHVAAVDGDAEPSESAPLIGASVNAEYNALPCIDWGSSACLAELEKITSRPVQTVPSFLLAATENFYGMSMGSCDKLSTNYEILDDRHILFEVENAFDICSAQLQSIFLQDEGGEKNFYD